MVVVAIDLQNGRELKNPCGIFTFLYLYLAMSVNMAWYRHHYDGESYTLHACSSIWSLQGMKGAAAHLKIVTKKDLFVLLVFLSVIVQLSKIIITNNSMTHKERHNKLLHFMEAKVFSVGW